MDKDTANIEFTEEQLKEYAQHLNTLIGQPVAILEYLTKNPGIYTALKKQNNPIVIGLTNAPMQSAANQEALNALIQNEKMFDENAAVEASDDVDMEGDNPEKHFDPIDVDYRPTGFDIYDAYKAYNFKQRGKRTHKQANIDYGGSANTIQATGNPEANKAQANVDQTYAASRAAANTNTDANAAMIAGMSSANDAMRQKADISMQSGQQRMQQEIQNQQAINDNENNNIQIANRNRLNVNETNYENAEIDREHAFQSRNNVATLMQDAKTRSDQIYSENINKQVEINRAKLDAILSEKRHRYFYQSNILRGLQAEYNAGNTSVKDELNRTKLEVEKIAREMNTLVQEHVQQNQMANHFITRKQVGVLNNLLNTAWNYANDNTATYGSRTNQNVYTDNERDVVNNKVKDIFEEGKELLKGITDIVGKSGMFGLNTAEHVRNRQRAEEIQKELVRLQEDKKKNPQLSQQIDRQAQELTQELNDLYLLVKKGSDNPLMQQANNQQAQIAQGSPAGAATVSNNGQQQVGQHKHGGIIPAGFTGNINNKFSTLSIPCSAGFFAKGGKVKKENKREPIGLSVSSLTAPSLDSEDFKVSIWDTEKEKKEKRKKKQEANKAQADIYKTLMKEKAEKREFKEKKRQKHLDRLTDFLNGTGV